MGMSRHAEAQMIAAMKQIDAGRMAEDVAREQGVRKHTNYAWNAKYGERQRSALDRASGRENRLLGQVIATNGLFTTFLDKQGTRKSGWRDRTS
jgi:Transposase